MTTTRHFYRFRWAIGMGCRRRDGATFTVTEIEANGSLMCCPRRLTFGCRSVGFEFRVDDDCASPHDIVHVESAWPIGGTEDL